MIALVGLHAPPGSVVRQAPTLAALPPSALAVAARCGTAAEVAALLAWYGTARPFGTPGAVCVVTPRDPELLRALVQSPVLVEPLLFVDELEPGGVLPAPVLERLWGRTVAGDMMAELVRAMGAEIRPRERRLLESLVPAGVSGRSVGWAARHAGTSEVSLRRWMDRLGLPSPKRLLKALRVGAVARLRSAGIPVEDAARACGWTGATAFRVSRRRARDWARESPAWAAVLAGGPIPPHGTAAPAE